MYSCKRIYICERTVLRRRGWWLALLLILLSAPVASQGDSAIVQVVRVIDGDTIQICCIFGDREKVRYIGINTPETKHPTKEVEHFGEEASEANRKLVDGKTVRLEFDVQEQDRYGRLLAYVYLEEGTFVNAWLAAWLRGGDDRTAECEAPGAVSEASAGGEGGRTGAVEVKSNA